jgi:tRNA (adenine22-N1)-methyltransferase
MLQTQNIPDTRLRSAIPYLKKGGRVADIGTDHAYLPIYLLEQGLVSRAVACDINEGPIRSARKNIAAAGLEERIETLCTDGLCGVEAFAPDDVMIFGMGGELIARILSDAPWVKDASIGLILQPMTRASVLRKWLLDNGFEILGETITFEDKYYQTIHARFSGEKTDYSDVELLLGRLNIASRPPLFEGFLRHEIKVLDAIIAGKLRGKNPDVAEDLKLKQSLEELL